MNFMAALRSAWRALASNALRSMLTMLGIIIGVAAVITMIAVGAGATQRVQEQMKGLGSNIMLVVPGGVTAGGVRQGAQTLQGLTEDDALAIALEVPEVQVAAPTSRTSAQLVAGNTNWASTVFGTTNDYLEARDWPLESGRLFEASEIQGSAKVAIIGQTVARELFGDMDPVDQTMRIKSVPVTVVGVLARKGQNSMGQDQDDTVIVPISTYRNRVQGSGGGRLKRVGSINVKVREGQSMKVAEESIKELLRQQPHRDPAGAGSVEPDHDAAALGRGRREPDRGRHRHHEHHAGERDRAHPRDRLAHGGGCARARHPHAVPDRSGDAEPDRRRHRRAAGRHRHLGGGPVCRLAGEHDAQLHRAGGGLLGAGGCVLRVLPGQAGFGAAADPGPAPRVMAPGDHAVKGA